ncbi:MAG: [FeFe] hydrogenase H-cluster radical SAM maturase HydG [Candidatus Micrarchaeota archaeon]
MFSLNESKINHLLSNACAPSESQLIAILQKAEQKKGLSLEEATTLLQINDESQLQKLFTSAGKIKNEIYGNRLVLFAPLYISDYCVNDCAYCGFHCSNKNLNRKLMTTEEIAEQTSIIIGMGHKRILLEVGEHPDTTIDYVCDAIRTIYKTKVGNGEIRRINVNIAATTTENYKKLKEAGIGTYQLFQETYHNETYQLLHHGPKADYERQLTAHERAFEAGIDDYGVGVLFGLYDYRFEVLSLLSHAKYMEEKYGVGPHTISVPRFQLANSVVFSPKHLVSDNNFLKLIAIIRLAVPYTGMIISTRETPKIRAKAFHIGISQTSAASRTAIGGYSSKENAQFTLADHRSVEDVIKDISKHGLLPSFCTACYRSNRTGDRFMQLAKTGNINHLCRPNAILTFKEYLMDYTSAETRKIGEQLIVHELEKIESQDRRLETQNRLKRIEQGERDLYF